MLCGINLSQNCDNRKEGPNTWISFELMDLKSVLVVPALASGSMTRGQSNCHENLGLKSYALRKGQLLTENMKNNRKGKAVALLNNLKHNSCGMLRDVRWICKDPSEVPVAMRTKFLASVMVLGVIRSEGDAMSSHFFEKGLRMNADTYINVLETVMKPWMDIVAAGNCSPVDDYVWSSIERDVNKTPPNTIQSVKKAVHTVITQMKKVIVAKAYASYRTRLQWDGPVSTTFDDAGKENTRPRSPKNFDRYERVEENIREYSTKNLMRLAATPFLALRFTKHGHISTTCPGKDVETGPNLHPPPSATDKLIARANIVQPRSSRYRGRIRRQELVAGQVMYDRIVYFLSEGDISLAKVIEIALSMEAAEKNTKLFHLEQGEDCVDKLRIERKVESNFQNGKCKHCGKPHKEPCRFKEAICFKCNKKGHIASICWSSRRNLRQHQNQPGNIHQIGDQEEEEEYVQKIISVTIPEYKINFASSDPPYLMELKVEGNFIKFEMDTGSGLTLISEKDFKNSLQHLKLEKASIIVRTYDGTVVPILGKINVKVECQDITYTLRALVVKGEKRALMGREWINRLKLGCFRGSSVPFAIRPAVTEALDKMVAKGYLCEVASSKWATPVVVVPKKNKEIRICCDFKVTLNKYLDTAAYPLPTQQDLFSTLAKGKYFSKLDLRNAYLQLEVDPGTRPLLTINTHKGLFRFKRMPFGLANAPSYFQSVMDRVLSGIGGVICYIDDVLIATASIEEHLALLKTIFARLAKYNIKLKKEKCLFLQKEIEYLGHLVTEEGIRPLDHKVQAIQKAKTPTNISELRSFLGLVNFYGKFIPNLPELLKPLHELLHKKRPWVWTKECGEAIDKCKNSITSERVLVPYDATLPLCLATDASQIGVGAVLSHIIEGQERPIMFASRTLSVAEQNYSQIEKEALAIIYGVTKFHQFIYGRKFILITDHKPLVTILGSRSGIPTLSTSRLQRWALILSAYTYDIKFRRTQDHGNADLLSRFPVGCEEIPRLNNVYALSFVEELPITAEEIATETEKDEVLSLAKFYTQQGWPEKVADHLRPYFQRKLELTVDGECLTHSGMNKMKAVARSHFWWPNLDTQIEFLVNKCRSCQQSQDGPNKGKWQPWKWSTRPWQRIHIDFANKENINLLIVVDSHSKWIEAIPMRETTTRKTIEQLRRLFSSYGLPEELVSDNGPQFTGSEMKGFLEGNGIKQTLIPAYHPQSNGLAERAVRTIKTALDKNKRKIGDTIQDTLSKVLLAYRSTPHVTTGKTPSELFIGRALRTRVSLIHPSLASRVRDQQARQMKYDRRTHLEEFQIDDLVWCKNFRGGDKWIPGKIVGKKGTRVYTILIHGQVKAYHRDQIRKRWRNGEEDESGDGERQPEHSRGAGPNAIISEVVRDRGYMESLSPGLTSQRSDQDSEVQSDTDDGKSLEPLPSLDPEALKEEGPVLRRNPPRARRLPALLANYIHRPSTPHRGGPYIYGQQEGDVQTAERRNELERQPMYLDIKYKGETLPAFLSYGVKCSRCQRQGHRRSNCPLNTKTPAEVSRQAPSNIDVAPPATAPTGQPTSPIPASSTVAAAPAVTSGTVASTLPLSVVLKSSPQHEQAKFGQMEVTSGEENEIQVSIPSRVGSKTGQQLKELPERIPSSLFDKAEQHLRLEKEPKRSGSTVLPRGCWIAYLPPRQLSIITSWPRAPNEIPSGFHQRPRDEHRDLPLPGPTSRRRRYSSSLPELQRRGRAPYSHQSLARVFASVVAALGQRVLWPGHIFIVSINVHGQEVSVINFHLSHNPCERHQQLQIIAATAVQENSWVLGDLNISEESPNDTASGTVESSELLDQTALVDVATFFDATHIPTRVASYGSRVDVSYLDRVLLPSRIVYHPLQALGPSSCPSLARSASFTFDNPAWLQCYSQAELLAEVRSLNVPRVADDDHIVRARRFLQARLGVDGSGLPITAQPSCVPACKDELPRRRRQHHRGHGVTTQSLFYPPALLRQSVVRLQRGYRIHPGDDDAPHPRRGRFPAAEIANASAFDIKTGSSIQWQADLAPKEMAASDMSIVAMPSVQFHSLTVSREIFVQEPGLQIPQISGEEKTAISRLRTEHLRMLKFNGKIKTFPKCHKYDSQPASPEHLLNCIKSSKKRPLGKPQDYNENLRQWNLMEIV
ncbi:K02A2.6-like [Cordylochernes scorpioides]|uniref:RNA-directed DNA polymerase n=1 Tax=Cordylochernes scorpioides TaxID=51811 RepID=A0ABY6KAB2_9ARAC|nr:K02A2.6-like [Cordylochernes scorpioides]